MPRDIFGEIEDPEFPIGSLVHFWLSEPDNPYQVKGHAEYDGTLVYLLESSKGERARSFESYLHAFEK